MLRAALAYRDVLIIRDARLLIGASAASQVGDWLYNAALLGYVYAATGSAAWVGAATIGRLIPYVLLSPAGGAVADRFPRRRVLLTGDLLRFGLMLGLAMVVASNGPIELVIGLTALASVAGTAERPAALALLPRLVGESRLGAANALLHTVQDLGVVVGPAIGALLLAFGTAWLAFVVNAATFAASAALVFIMRDRSRPPRVRDSPAAHIAQGLRVARATRFLLPLMLVAGTVELTYADRSARDLRSALAGSGQRRIRGAAHRGGCRRRPQHARKRAAGHRPPRDSRGHQHRDGRRCNPARVRRNGGARPGAGGHGARRGGARLLRGPRRNDARADRRSGSVGARRRDLRGRLRRGDGRRRAAGPDRDRGHFVEGELFDPRGRVDRGRHAWLDRAPRSMRQACGGRRSWHRASR